MLDRKLVSLQYLLLGRVSKLTTSFVVVLVVIPSIQGWLEKNMLTTSSMVALAIPSVQSMLKVFSSRKTTEGRKNRSTTSSVVVLVMSPSMQFLLQLVSWWEITEGRRKNRSTASS